MTGSKWIILSYDFDLIFFIYFINSIIMKNYIKQCKAYKEFVSVRVTVDDCGEIFVQKWDCFKSRVLRDERRNILSFLLVLGYFLRENAS